MRLGSWSARSSLVLALLIGCSGPSGGARGDRDLSRAEEGRLDDGWILAVESGGMDALLPDARDAGLRRALDGLDERLLELAAQSGKFVPPPGSMELLCTLLRAPWRMQVGAFEGAAPGTIPVRAQWTFRGRDAAEAREWMQRFDGFVRLFGLPRADPHDDVGLVGITLPQGPILYGNPDEGATFVLRWGPAGADVRPLGTGLPRGVRPALALELELGRLLALIGTSGKEIDDPFLRECVEHGQGLGLSLAVGHDAERMRTAVRYRGWAPMMEAFEMLDRTPLPHEHLDVIPADATLASITRIRPTFWMHLVEMLDEREDKDVLAELEQALGLPLADLIEPLEGTFGYFLSDATGGGGLSSMVFFASVKDEPRMARSLEHLASRANAAAREQADGAFRVRAYAVGDAACLSLTFPGLPVPLEPCVGKVAGQLLIAATPQALAGALDHLQSGRAGLRAHPALRRLGRGALDDLQGLQFLDTPRVLRDGYGLLGLLTSALANGVRSTTDEAREPGSVLPPYHELSKGAQPGLVLVRLDGADLVLTGESDRSALVQIGSTLNFLPPFLLPAFAGAWLGAAQAFPEPADPFQYEIF